MKSANATVSGGSIEEGRTSCTSFGVSYTDGIAETFPGTWWRLVCRKYSDLVFSTCDDYIERLTLRRSVVLW